MKQFLLYIWQLPQNLLGFLLCAIFKEEKSLEYKGYKMRVNSNFPGGVSLGKYTFLSKYPHDKKTWNTVKHEYGHHLQSVDWGWLYLIVIGLPSILFNLFDRVFHDDDVKWIKWYYNLPWEKDADKRGGVER